MLLLDNKEFHFSKQDLPCLIHGGHGAGASLFTVSVLADLSLQGNKLLFLSGYQMARDEFITQTGNPQTTKIVESEEQLQNSSHIKTIFIKRETPELFLTALAALSDIDERVILIKNFELFGQSLFTAVKEKSNLILSGDLDACTFTDVLLDKKWKTEIYFSQPKRSLDFDFPVLEQYQGYLRGENKKGIVALKI